MVDQMLVCLCMEKIVDRINRINRIKIGLSKGVLIHFQFHVHAFSSKKVVRAMSVIRWMVAISQPWTDARARGVKMSRA